MSKPGAICVQRFLQHDYDPKVLLEMVRTGLCEYVPDTQAGVTVPCFRLAFNEKRSWSELYDLALASLAKLEKEISEIGGN